MVQPLPRSKPASPPAQQSASIQPESIITAAPDDDEACLAALRDLKVEFSPAAEPAAGNASCRVPTPVILVAAATARGRIEFPERPLLGCRFARQFVTWVAATDRISALGKVWTGPGFQCRGRNGDSSAKLSEHALGNAVDVTTIATADGRSIAVADAASPLSRDYAMLKAIRSLACDYFTTVLGPGANSAHATHFHFDLAQHGHSKDYRICE